MNDIQGNAEILLVRHDGALILQLRDDKPGIANPGFVATFGGHIEGGEKPLAAAVREINEETSLTLSESDLEFFGKYHKTRAIHGEDWDVYYFVAKNISDDNLKVYEGTGYAVIHDRAELASVKATKLLQQFLDDYYTRTP